MARQSIKTSRTNSTNTQNIKATTTALTLLRKIEKNWDFRSLGIIGLRTKTKINDGKNIPNEAMIDVPKPPNKYPTNAAVERTGPGVN